VRPIPTPSCKALYHEETYKSMEKADDLEKSSVPGKTDCLEHYFENLLDSLLEQPLLGYSDKGGICRDCAVLDKHTQAAIS